MVTQVSEHRRLRLPGLIDNLALAAVPGLLGDLIAYWPCNESGNALDLHTNGLTLTDNNTVSGASGKVYALARQFTRANSEFLSRASEALLQAGDIAFTLAAWAYADSSPSGSQCYNVAGKDDVSVSREYQITWNGPSNRFEFAVYDGGTTQRGLICADTLGAPSTAVWYLIIGWHDPDANTVSIQVNDGGVDSTGTTGAVGTGACTFRVGLVSSGTHYWNGRIGPVMYWKKILTSTQRTALYNLGAGVPYANFTT